MSCIPISMGIKVSNINIPQFYRGGIHSIVSVCEGNNTNNQPNQGNNRS